MQRRPFFDFINSIGFYPDALDAFVDDPDGDPNAKELTPEQKDALLSGSWEKIEALVRLEFPDLDLQEQQTQIGWNMQGVGPLIEARRQQQP